MFESSLLHDLRVGADGGWEMAREERLHPVTETPTADHEYAGATAGAAMLANG